jgi:hypothetical protein
MSQHGWQQHFYQENYIELKLTNAEKVSYFILTPLNLLASLVVLSF